jgi:hypothetical protein
MVKPTTHPTLEARPASTTRPPVEAKRASA